MDTWDNYKRWPHWTVRVCRCHRHRVAGGPVFTLAAQHDFHQWQLLASDRRQLHVDLMSGRWQT